MFQNILHKISVGILLHAFEPNFEARNYFMSNRDCTADDPTNRCFECLKAFLFELMCENLHCRGEEWIVVRFLRLDSWIFPNTSGGAPFRIHRSTLL